MPINGIVNTARSLSYFLRMQEVTSNNIANADTDGFKAERLAAHLLSESTPNAGTVPVQTLDLTQGTLRDTGRPLDLALQGPGFFVVHTDLGDRLTRGGSFTLDGDGRMIDMHGDPLLGTDGEIVLSGGDAEIRDDGSIFVDGTFAGELRIVRPDDPATLLKEEKGRFVPTSLLNPIESGETVVHQGSIEEANCDPLTSMIDMLTIQRAYSANIEALRAMDSVLGLVTGEVGKV
jgi:flagellar basal-body rod protein FlgF